MQGKRVLMVLVCVMLMIGLVLPLLASGADEGKKLRKSHDNPSVRQLYEEFLGRPLGRCLSRAVLHPLPLLAESLDLFPTLRTLLPLFVGHGLESARKFFAFCQLVQRRGKHEALVR